MRALSLLVLVITLSSPGAALGAPGDPDSSAPPDTVPGVLEFTPSSRAEEPADSAASPQVWLSAPFGERLLTEPEAWTGRRALTTGPVLDYNRVDLLRFGLTAEAQAPRTMRPRVGARLEYSTGRRRVLYGFQLEQPLLRRSRLAVGGWASRRTDHPELEQVDDLENTLALLLFHQDYRDYFEREGYGGYLAWRVPDFSVVSVHLRSDEYRSLRVQDRTRSLFLRHRPLRANPPVDEGTIHAVAVRLEREARRTRSMRAGLYHWVELERAGRGLGGDFDYTRLLADLRSVLRLAPSATLALRGVAGSALSGELPFQKTFTVGGVDGLRAHPFAWSRGDQMALAQAEATVALWRVRPSGFDSGLHALVFLDAGRAWSDPAHRWSLGRQHVPLDGGLGLATSEQNLRVYVARDLQQRRARAVWSVRLMRPF